MYRVCVVQVLGRLGREAYEEVDFRIEDRVIGSKRLSSEAICEYYTSTRKDIACRPYILAPESLITNCVKDWGELKSFYTRNPPRTFKELIEKTNTYKIRLRSLFFKQLSSITGLKEEYLEVIPSIGYYRSRRVDYGILYSGLEITDIDIYLFLTLLDTIRECDIIIADVSTGHNIYASSLVRALQNIIIAYKFSILDRLLSKPSTRESSSKEFYIVSTPPVIRGYRGPYNISKYTIDIQVYLRYPIESKAINSVKVEKILGLTGEEVGSDKLLRDLNRSLFSIIRKYISYGLTLHNAIKYNTPLVLYQYDEVLELKNIDIKNIIADIDKVIHEVKDYVKARLLGFRDIEVSEDNRTVNVLRRSGIDKDLLFNTIFSLQITSALMRFVDSIREDVSEKGVSIVGLRERFIPGEDIGKGVYNLFPELYLNKAMLSRDLYEIESYLEKNIVKEDECILLSEAKNKLLGRETRVREIKDSSGKRYSDVMRNFFAHSGLLDSITLICRDKRGYHLKYVDIKSLKKRGIDIRGWLNKVGT